MNFIMRSFEVTFIKSDALENYLDMEIAVDVATSVERHVVVQEARGQTLRLKIEIS